MEKIPLDTVLEPKNFSSFTYTRLISFLSENDSWKIIARMFGIFSNLELEDIARSRDPAERLILELSARLCPVGLFCDILKECRLFKILMLFKPHEPIVILEQPMLTNHETMVINRGSQLYLRCRATGLPLPTYQWYRNYDKIPTQKEPELCVINFGPEDEGEYFCILTQEGFNHLRPTHSVIVKMTPEVPVLTVQPPVSTICNVGATIILSITATGHPELSYQWYKSDKKIIGSTDPILVLKVKDESYDGVYRCHIYNVMGEIWTNDSLLTVTSSVGPEPSAKIALLIANQLYDNLHSLRTPENDVRSLVYILEDLGFHTIALQNLNLTEMRNIVYYFSDIVPKNAYVLFYFSGHGFEIYDKFMLPVNIPGPEDFLQADAFSERELLKAILKSEPMLFLELLDMCLKPPDPLNKKIFNERINLYEYSGSHNLIQAYSTTSCSVAYEKKMEQNGLYVKSLKEYVLRKRDMPIVEILGNVAKDIARVCPIQKPFFGTNITMDYRLTDRSPYNPEIGQKIKALSVVPPDFILPFKRVGIYSRVSLSPFLGVFPNTIEARFSDLADFRLSCDVHGGELCMELFRIGGEAYIKVMNIQRLITHKYMTLRLYEQNGKYVDSAVWNIKKPIIAAIALRDAAHLRAPVRSRQRRKSDGEYTYK